MNTTRRRFLQSAAAAPAVAAATAIPAVAAEPIAAIAAVPHEYMWYFSSDGGERYGEIFNTRDQALEFLKHEGYGLIAECQKQDYHLDVDGGDILNLLYGQNEDFMDEDGEFIDCTPEQTHDLGDMVTAAIAQWVAKHKIDVRAWAFGDVRNQVRADEVCPPPTICAANG